MLIYHHAHSEFLLETAHGFRILTDPFDAHVGYPMHDVACDAVTVSHGHGDHSYTQKAQGNIVIADHPGRLVLGNDVYAQGIPAWHDDAQGAKRGANIIFVLETEGLRIAHLGDLGAWDEPLAAQLEGLDIVFVPVGGFYTLPPARAAALMQRIQPRMIIPMHYRTAYNADWPIAPVTEFLSAMGQDAVPTLPLVRVTSEDLSEQPHLLLLSDRV